MPPSGLVVSQIQGVTVVNFRDSSILDGVAVQTLGEELYKLVDEQAQRKIILDFGPVRFLSSSMVGVIISLNKKAKAIEGQMVICGLRPELFKVFKIMSLDRVIPFAKDEQEAMIKLGVFTA